MKKKTRDQREQPISPSRISALRKLFPEAFVGERIDFSVLGSLLGVPFGEEESYGIAWSGKRDAMARAKEPAMATLEPCKKASVEWEHTQNIFIEGDNLAALKLLQTSHEGKVKMIYIDPPYNTGKEFVYTDDFRQTARQYQKATGRRIECNSRGDGERYHANWLNMIYPRLLQTRTLLREDGVIFVSIDDHEVHHLRMLMDEIYGRKNFVQNFMWLHGKGKKDAQSRTLQQYILCYAKDKRKLKNWSVKIWKEYENRRNPDGDPRGDWFSGSISFSEKRSNPDHANYFSITSPSGKVWTRQWLCTEEEMRRHLHAKNIYFGQAPNYTQVPRLKMFPHYDWVIPPNIISDVGTTQSAVRELDQLMGEKVFDYPKPVMLIERLIEMACPDEGLVVDFFAGSGTTGEAVMRWNAKHQSALRFLLVQIPDALPADVVREERKTIADICMERLRKCGNRLTASHAKSDLPLDVGFRAFRLLNDTPSNFEG